MPSTSFSGRLRRWLRVSRFLKATLERAGFEKDKVDVLSGGAGFQTWLLLADCGWGGLHIQCHL
jgi:hypothetical protein